MKIYFTIPKELIEIVGKDLEGLKTDIEKVRLPPEANKIIAYLKDFIEQRLNIYKEDIDAEEAENENVYTLMNFSKHPLVIQHLNYSHKLALKMEESITPQDLIFIEKALTGKIDLNKT